MKIRRFVSLALALLTTVALTACGGNTEATSTNNSQAGGKDTSANVQTTTTEEPQYSMYGGKVTVGIQQDIDSLDPHKATAAGTKEILFNIFEGLVKSDENGNLIDAVAESHSISDDGLVYTFKLRKGVKFHNGADVTVADVKYSLDRAAGLPAAADGTRTPLVSTLKVVQSVETPDDETVVVTVSAVNPELIYSFVAAIIPEGSGEVENADPVGTGPFSFVSYTVQQGVVLKKNESYWQEGLPYLDEVEFKIVTDGSTALMELEGGNINVYPYLTDSQVLELGDKVQILSNASNVVQALFLNNAVAPLDDIRVRQAICLALDKNSINDMVDGGRGVLIGSAMLPTLRDYYVDSNELFGKEARVEEAKQLLAEAGYADGFDFPIMIPSSYEVHMQTGEVIVENLKAVGINAYIDAVEWNTWLSDCYTDRNYVASVCGITCDTTPGYLLNRFCTDSKKNFINFNSSEFDELYAQCQAATTMEERAVYYKQLQQVLLAEAATGFIMAPPITVAVDNKLAGYKFYPIYVQDMSCVYYTE